MSKIKIDKDTTLPELIINTIIAERGWWNSNYNLLYTIPKEDRIREDLTLISKDYGPIINQNYFTKDDAENVYKNVDIKKLNDAWKSNMVKHDYYLMEVLHENIIEFLRINNKRDGVFISVNDCEEDDHKLDYSNCGTFLITEKEIKFLG